MVSNSGLQPMNHVLTPKTAGFEVSESSRGRGGRRVVVEGGGDGGGGRRVVGGGG